MQVSTLKLNTEIIKMCGNKGKTHVQALLICGLIKCYLNISIILINEHLSGVRPLKVGLVDECISSSSVSDTDSQSANCQVNRARRKCL